MRVYEKLRGYAAKHPDLWADVAEIEMNWRDLMEFEENHTGEIKIVNGRPGPDFDVRTIMCSKPVTPYIKTLPQGQFRLVFKA